MSAFVLSQDEINLLTEATDAALRLNKQYCDSYLLHEETRKLLGKYAGDLHNIYRALYITNIKAVNGRYGDNEKTLPKYKPLHAWDTERISIDKLKKAACLFSCYMYQISEDPIYRGPAWNAFADIQKLLCMIFVNKSYGWHGEPA